MRLIGRECKYSNVLSGPILICRGLDLSDALTEASASEAMAGKVELISKKRPKGSVFDESESPKRSKNTQRTQKFVLFYIVLKA